MLELKRLRADAAVRLGEELMATGRLPFGWMEDAEPTGGMVDLDLIRQLTTKAAVFLPAERMDAWLAPRLHCAVRIPRRIALDDGVWAWLAFQNNEFVEGRFRKGKEKVHSWRYRGIWSRNALARLWWGAEMTRNGPDYSASEACFARTRTAQFALELMYSWDRAAAIAFVKVTEGMTGKARLSDDLTRALSTKLKVYLALRSLSAFGNNEEEDTEEFDADWAAHVPSFATLATNDVRQLRGPSTGTCSALRIAAIAAWLEDIVEETQHAVEGERSVEAVSEISALS